MQDNLLLEGDEARIARLVQEARLKNPMNEMMSSSPSKSNNYVNNQQNVTQLAVSLAHVMRMGLPFGVDPSMNKDGAFPLRKPEGQKQLKRLRLEDSEEGAEIIPTDVDVIVLNRTASSNVLVSDDVAMYELASAANLIVMAGPEHQARQEK